MTTRTIILPSIETPDIKTQEIWEIIDLPEKSCKELAEHSPENINNLIDRARKQYEDYICELGSNFDLINKEIETDIRLKSSVLKDELNLLKTYGNENIDKLLSFRNELFSFEEIKFSDSKTFCKNLMKKGQFLIHEFHEFLNYLEKYRSDKFKEILKNFYVKFETCSYKLPYDIQLFFEDQIQHINQMLLTNLRNYKELELDLILIFTNDIKLLIYNISKFKEEWKDICKAEMIRRLKECELSDEEIDEFFKKYLDKSIAELVELFYEFEAHVLYLAKNKPEDIEWYNGTKSVIDELDVTTKQLVNLYETVMTQLGDKAVPLLSAFALNSVQVSPTQSNKELLEEEIEPEPEFVPEEGDLGSETSLSIKDLEVLWKNTLKQLLQFAHCKFVFLNELTELWDSHERRIEDTKTVILADLEKLVLKNDQTLQEKQEMALNVAIDTLRQELNEANMIKSMKKVTSILRKIAQMMAGHKEAEIKLVSKYSDYIYNESEVFTTAIDIFIRKYTVEENIPTLRKELGIKNLDLFAELEHIVAPNGDINFWQNRIVEQMRKRKDTYEEKLQEKIDSWIEENSKIAVTKYQNKLDLHKMRYDRIQLEIYDVRLAEIKKHQQKFDTHKIGLENSLTEIQEHLNDFVNAQELDIDNFLTKLKEIGEKCNDCKSADRTEIYINDTKRIVEKQNDYLKNTIKNYSEQALKKMNQILTSNYNFLQHIKLFAEGGNFNPKEASMLAKKITQLDTVTRKKCAAFKLQLTTTEKKLLKNIDTTFIACNVRETEIFKMLKFRETTDQTTRNLQGEIKNEVYQMKYKRKKIDTINEKIKQLTSTNNFSNAWLVIKYSKELIYHYNDFKKYLEDAENPSRSTFSLKTNLKLQTTTLHSLKNTLKCFYTYPNVHNRRAKTYVFALFFYISYKIK